jgi:hypothetical protein
MKNRLTYIVVALLAASPLCTLAEENKDGGGDLRAAVQNPISSLVSLPFKFTFDYGAKNGDGTILSLQPVYPVTKGNWNYVSRMLLPVASVDGAISTPENPNPRGSDSASGLGDINYSLYMSPVKYDKVIWGVGPSIMLPTATDDQLGSGKWSGGITGVALTQPGWGTMGILGRHLWSFAGDDKRSDVNQTLIEPFANYNLDKGWYLVTDIIITANWEAPSNQTWTVPLGGGIGRIYKIGNQAVNNRLEFYYSVEKPDSAPDWSWSFTFQFLLPK